MNNRAGDRNFQLQFLQLCLLFVFKSTAKRVKNWKHSLKWWSVSIINFIDIWPSWSKAQTWTELVLCRESNTPWEKVITHQKISFRMDPKEGMISPPRTWQLNPSGKSRKLMVCKTSRRRPGLLLNVLHTYNLCAIWKGYLCLNICLLATVLLCLFYFSCYCWRHGNDGTEFSSGKATSHHHW